MIFGILSHRIFARLFAAQVIALLGSGLMTVALGLLAHDLAGANAGTVLGAAFTVKMVAYVGLSPVASAVAERLPRKAVLIGADLVRAGAALSLPFLTEIWQILTLIFVLQAASATFTPAFQATIPDILPDETDYTRALSLSRLAYDLDSLLSPALAGLALLLMPYSALFGGTVLGFLASATLVLATALPRRQTDPNRRSFAQRLTRGIRIYLATPRLRGLLALNLTASAVGAFVLVNTVVLVLDRYRGDAAELALAMACFGFGSMAAALTLPRLLDQQSDRGVMVPAATALALSALAYAAWLAAALPPLPATLAAWVTFGALYSAVLTPSGRLLRRSAHPRDRPAIFAAQFALSHACWLLAYPFAGWAGARVGLSPTLAVLGLVGLGSAYAARRLWPAGQPAELAHSHPDLSANHPHLRTHGRHHHVHAFVIDDEHRVWPSQG